MPDQSGLSVQLSPVTSAFKVLRVVNPVAPVEFPCPPADKDVPMCSRANSLADLAQRYGPAGAGTEGALLGLCGYTPQSLAALSDGTTARTSCTFQVPESGDIVGVLGHMHTLGSTFRLTLDPGTPKQKILLDIPHWSFNWQMNYGLVTPLHVTAGEPVRMDCSWDRRLDPTRAPKYIVFSEGTEDEMCFGTYSLIPDNQ